MTRVKIQGENKVIDIHNEQKETKLFRNLYTGKSRFHIKEGALYVFKNVYLKSVLTDKKIIVGHKVVRISLTHFGLENGNNLVTRTVGDTLVISKTI